MRKYTDISKCKLVPIGTIFGIQEVIGNFQLLPNGHKRYLYTDCKCTQCGKISQRSVYELKNGKRSSCECQHIIHSEARRQSVPIGTMFGTLKTINECYTIKGKTHVECQCILCGKITYPKLAKLKRRRSDSLCRCQSDELFKEMAQKCKDKKPGWTGCGEISGSVWKNIKNGAIRTGKVFDITIEYAWDLFLKQNRKCSLTGLDLCFTASRREFTSKTASLDRINSNQGYIIGNVQWVHKVVNNMKHTSTTEELLEWCNKIVNHSKIKTEVSLIDYNLSKNIGICNHVWNTIKGHAIYEGKDFEINNQYAWDLYLQQDKKCIISGVQIFFPVECKRAYKNRTASLDRIDSSIGYIHGNVQWTHQVVNYMKNKRSTQELINWCQKILDYNAAKTIYKMGEGI